jgi:putative DNA primase/helicase
MHFVEIARSHGLLIESAVPDGRIHRVATEEKPRKRNGSYRLTGDWGWVCNFNRSDEVHVWRERDAAPSPFQRPARVPPAVQRVMAEEREKRSRAAQRAARVIEGCALREHPYMAAKRLAGVPVLVDGEGVMVVPMRHFSDARRLQSVQWIWPDGTKKFMPGGAAAEAVHTLGPVGASETWLVEGYATGVSVQMALKQLRRPARVMVCFSAGNLARVGRQLTGYVRVVADHDASQAGLQAAVSSGHGWVMPDVEGWDANDLMAHRGLAAVVELLRGAL